MAAKKKLKGGKPVKNAKSPRIAVNHNEVILRS